MEKTFHLRLLQYCWPAARVDLMAAFPCVISSIRADLPYLTLYRQKQLGQYLRVMNFGLSQVSGDISRLSRGSRLKFPTAPA
jgi:hypothetical protein